MTQQRADPGRYLVDLDWIPDRDWRDWSAVCTGLVLPYNRTLRDAQGHSEWFWQGAFVDDDESTVPLLVDHDTDRHVGWATLDHRADGLHCRGQLRRDAHRVIGDRRELSIGCAVTFETTDRRLTRVYRARALEVSIVHAGAWHGRVALTEPAAIRRSD
jgi:hypothetical protein